MATDGSKAGGVMTAGETGGNYTVLARRYRSRDFVEVVGQEPIAETLQRAIAQGRTAHAYLFCGTRGVGKTSMARIFAKALQLSAPEGGDAEGAPTEADAIADAVLRGEDLDVIEIDGASNRGIAEARELIAGSGLAPTRGRFKIYIIDEVHMLTREAFNALLKTMEEPPPHVKFILCTTDPQKVPATIQSRCQRFDFKAIPTSRIAAHLTEVLSSEGVEADEDVVLTVASLGNGSMRDALSLLDRLLAGGEGRLTMDVAKTILGLPATEIIDSVIDAVVAGDPAAGLTTANELIVGGATVESALEMLVDRFRALMLVSACGAETDLVDLTSESRAKAVEHASHFDTAGLVYVIATCDAVARNARGSATGRALFDACIVRLCLAERFGDVARMLSGSTVGAGEKKKVAESAEARPAVKSAASTTTDRAPSGGIAVGGRASTPPRSPGASSSASSSAAAATPAEPAAASAPEPAFPADGPIDLPTLWKRFQSSASASVTAILGRIRPLRLDDREIVVAATDDRGAGFLAKQVERLAEPLSEVAGRRLTIRLDTSGTSAGGGGAASSNSGAPAGGRESGSPAGGEDIASAPSSPSRSDVAEAMEIPAVRDAIAVFDATVRDVRPAPSPVAPEPTADDDSGDPDADPGTD